MRCHLALPCFEYYRPRAWNGGGVLDRNYNPLSTDFHSRNRGRGRELIVRFVTLGIALLVSFHQTAVAAAAKSISCSYANGQRLTFEVPKKLGDMPSIEFDYPSKVTLFSFRDNNLLLVAMDQEQTSRVRIVISAQHANGKASYDGQILTDSGGNQIMLDNGPVSCKAGG
jgi:hypothetical protein